MHARGFAPEDCGPWEERHRAWHARHPRPFFRWRMHRRIFASLAGAILFVAIVMGIIGRLSSPWQNEEQKIRAFVAREFEADWDDPAKRSARAHRMSESLGVGLRLEGGDGALLESMGPECKRPYEIAVEGPTGRRGTVLACYPMRHSAKTFLFVGGVLVLCLWLAAGKIARRLARPLGEVARVADELGSGNLSARARLPHDYGEIEHVARGLNRMAERIEGQLQDQRALLAGVSHEIRTPLARMRFLIERLRSRGADATLDEMDREVLEMDDLVGELLAGSRIDFGAIAKQPVDVAEVAVTVLERLDVAPERLVVEGEDRTVQADPTLLRRALSNLVANARRHGDGVAQLVVTCDQMLVRFEVLDEGPGFPEGEADTYFAPFKSGGAEGSVGLGLSLVRRIAEAHGGRAFAENRQPKGARVVFEIARG